MPKKYDHSKISVTSGIQYLRTFTDIPFAKEIYKECARINDRGINYYEQRQNMGHLLERTPYFEGRFKITNRLLKQSGIKNILEIAAGFSPRGMIMSENPSVQYIETDLPDIIIKKEKIARKILKAKRKNLSFKSANALSLKDLKAAIGELKQGSVCIINEGLLRYLTFSERKKIAKNIIYILKKRGGIWITTDTLSGFNSGKILNKIIEKETSRSIEKYAFKTEKDAVIFFEDQGFKVKKYPYSKIIKQLSSPKILKLKKKGLKIS